ncbi:MAG: DASS family sodium-coupled anion symporter [Nitrospirota bacterium]|nr:MAG: DASS family sodium-coupled anion symporter [Nitrospirota bacterium]
MKSEIQKPPDHRKERIGLVVGPVFAGLIYLLLPDTLAHEARTLAAILTWVVVYWITEPIPIPITALLGTGLCVLTGLGSMKTVFSAYAHPIIFLFIGSFFLAEALTVHGLDKRFGIWLLSLKWVGMRPVRIFIAMGCAVAALSMWISNTAAAALMLPIALGVLTTIRGPHEGPTQFDTGFLLLVAYGAGVGGVVTIIGTPPNLIGVALLSEQANIDISFGTWMALGLPLGVFMLGVVSLYLLKLSPPPSTIAGSGAMIEEQRVRLGQWSRGERNAFLGFSLAVVLWIVPGILSASLGTDHAVVSWLKLHLPKELVPIIAAGLLFLLPINFQQRTFTLTWKQAVNINWGTILLFGGGIAFGGLMVKTQLAYTIGEGLVGLFGVQSVWGLTAVAIGAAIILTELASNTAAASMLVPVVIAIAHAAGVSPLPPTLGACMGASLAFVLPVSTPPNAIVYGTGYVPITSMIRAGLILDILGGIVIWVTLRLLCPLIGLS